MFGFLVKIGKKASSYRQGRTNDRAFAALNDRTLQDIGVNRHRMRSGEAGPHWSNYDRL